MKLCLNNLLLLTLIIGALLLIFIKSGTEEHFVQNIPKKCYPIIDPTTLKSLDIKTEKGQNILKQYMVFHFQKYLTDTKNDWNYILPTELEKMDRSKIFVLDVRKPEDYKKMHIMGSINIFWLDLMKPENLAKLPKDKKIIIICYVGHTASQILVLLKLLGYDAVVLKFGMGVSPKRGVPVAGWTDYGFPVNTN